MTPQTIIEKNESAEPNNPSDDRLWLVALMPIA
jgi:hypothetical protein